MGRSLTIPVSCGDLGTPLSGSTEQREVLAEGGSGWVGMGQRWLGRKNFQSCKLVISTKKKVFLNLSCRVRLCMTGICMQGPICQQSSRTRNVGSAAGKHQIYLMLLCFETCHLESFYGFPTNLYAHT